ncbi:MAG: Hsp20/alpha crystallin family protein [Phycisphaerales bacterium]|nr:Hsp20/alpha crystallin family protein [Phycisphaerales bacterium]
MNTRALFTPAGNAMTLVRNEVERMFDNVLASHSGTRAYPSLNMIDDDNNVYVEAELPGVRMEDVDVTVADGVLTISGRRTVTTPVDTNAIRRERGDLEFERSISLPANVEANGTEAVLREGVLLLTMPKSENAKARRVQVTEG